ncbi:hypothetical protein EYM_05010 [Ignicoccus islandicus DSM 13165]|uniref:Thil AANH domain-containing protein n=1 Tax=Ignicoccus islandicus DSM 13165 TaxID=940295 RepID=A0A0U3EB52_9CREN|nr:hypothetical protein [Ignicoccus islandicus]ALU12542.1 hypothetical protein EYM_05010 [Ignicoccus islandicus DSM 13165]
MTILLFSGGIDSFVLSKLLNVNKVAHFIVDPRASKLALMELFRLNPSFEVHLFDHRPYLRKVLEALSKARLSSYLCLACKRAMILRAAQIDEEIVIGDSIGQVASQTLRNASYLSKGVTLYRPLGGSDKEDEEEHLSDDLSVLARKVSSFKCPWKPPRVVTQMKREVEVLLDEIVYENLSYSVYLGMKKAREITSMG